jgi:hypothetical protein
MLGTWRLIGRSRVKDAAISALLSMGLVSLLLLFAWYEFGSFAYAAAYFRGEHLFVENPFQSLGSIQQGRSREAALIIVNREDKPVSIIGWNVNCGCTSLAGLPLTIPSGQRRSIRVIVRPERSRDAIVHIKLFSDDAKFPIIDAQIQFKVVANGST